MVLLDILRIVLGCIGWLACFIPLIWFWNWKVPELLRERKSRKEKSQNENQNL